MSARRAVASNARDRFARRASQVRRRRLRIVGLALLVAALLGGLVWLVAFSSVLSATSVRVEGVADADASAVVDAAQVPLGTPLARVDTGAIAERVRREVLFVKDSTASRAWPQTIVVEVVPRTALLAVQGSEGQLSLVDDQGVAFRQVGSLPQDLPAVSASETPSTDGLATVVDALALLSEDQRKSVTAISVSSGDLVAFTLGKVQVVWGGRGEGAKKLAVLNALLKTEPALVDVSAPDTPVTR